METLKHLQPGTESITYEQLRTSMRAVIRDELPQKNEISRVLDKIAEISYTDSSSTPVIDWQSDSGLLTITDPFFAFFLKWSSYTVSSIAPSLMVARSPGGSQQ